MALLGAAGASRNGGTAPRPAASGPIRFIDATRASGVIFRFANDLRRGRSLATVGGGVATADLDGDGFPEIFFTGSVRDGRHPERGPHGVLYWNHGDGAFEDRTERAGMIETGWAMAAHFADLDGDGLPDLLVTASGGNRLYKNCGGGSFSIVPEAGGLAGGLWSVGAAFLDADRDGLVDVYIGDYLATDYAREQLFPALQVRTPDDYEGLPNKLYLQRPGGAFVEATADSGAAAPSSKTLGVSAFDFDGDGIDDLFVANDRTPNELFRGRGNGTFEDATDASGVGEVSGRTGPRAGMGIAVGDVDGDDDTDILVTNFAGEPVTYYRNSGKGIFEDATEQAGLASGTRPYVQWGVHLEDLDNDGNLDLPIVSGHLVPKLLTLMAGLFRKGGAGPYGRGCRAYRQPAVLYRGLGNGQFQEVTAGSGDFGRMRISGRGSACADFDGDGLLDLAIAAVSGGVRILRNVTQGAGHAIELLPSPAAAGGLAASTVVGMRVAVTSRGRRQVREFMVVPSYASGSWLPLHFGLGDATIAERVEVIPPGSGLAAAVYANLPADGLYALEPSGPRLVRAFEKSRKAGVRGAPGS